MDDFSFFVDFICMILILLNIIIIYRFVSYFVFRRHQIEIKNDVFNGILIKKNVIYKRKVRFFFSLFSCRLLLFSRESICYKIRSFIIKF